MSDNEYRIAPQAQQKPSADANTPGQNPVPMPANPAQPRIVLPGQEAITPAIYSDQTMPFGINYLPPTVPDIPMSSIPAAAPKAEPLGAAIFYQAVPTAYPNVAQLPPVPPNGQQHARFAKGTWLLALPIGLAIIAVVFALLVIPVSAFWLPQMGAKATAVVSRPTTAAVAPIPTPVPAVIPTPTAMDANAVSANGVTVTPNSFNIQDDCQSDGDYRCTVTLALSADANTAVAWSASLNGVDHSFHPHHGRLEPGQQQQIIIYLHDSCPIDAEFDVAVRQQQLNIPMHCN